MNWGQKPPKHRTRMSRPHSPDSGTLNSTAGSRSLVEPHCISRLVWTTVQYQHLILHAALKIMWWISSTRVLTLSPVYHRLPGYLWQWDRSDVLVTITAEMFNLKNQVFEQWEKTETQWGNASSPKTALAGKAVHRRVTQMLQICFFFSEYGCMELFPLLLGVFKLLNSEMSLDGWMEFKGLKLFLGKPQKGRISSKKQTHSIFPEHNYRKERALISFRD